MFKGAALHAFVYLQVHGVAFGLNPHIPHVTISEEQQAFSCDVIIFKEVRVALHVVCTDPWNTKSAPTNQFFYYHLWTIVDGEGGGTYLCQKPAASRNTETQKQQCLPLSKINVFMQICVNTTMILTTCSSVQVYMSRVGSSCREGDI